jgi:hypothetical protein
LSDRLAKSFDKYLFLAVENNTSARIRLLRLGWKEFVDSEHPETTSPAEMAAEAILYIGVHDDCWVDESLLIFAALAFLKEHYQEEPRLPIQHLADALKQVPVNADKVRAWCRGAFSI